MRQLRHRGESEVWQLGHWWFSSLALGVLLIFLLEDEEGAVELRGMWGLPCEWEGEYAPKAPLGFGRGIEIGWVEEDDALRPCCLTGEAAAPN
jgi:hypothetical protein